MRTDDKIFMMKFEEITKWKSGGSQRQEIKILNGERNKEPEKGRGVTEEKSWWLRKERKEKKEENIMK